jgi:hypothetical protein
VVAVSSPGAAAQTPPEVDQSFTGPHTGVADLTGCCDYTAQTFTAGRNGVLAGVNIATEHQGGPDAPLRVSIYNVDGSVPGSAVLATRLLPSADVPFSQLITFPQRVEVRAGVKYAVVINLENPSPLTSAVAFDGRDGYPGGAQCGWGRYRPEIENEEWFCYSAEFGFRDPAWFDLLFRTYVTPLVPAAKDQCKNGGWRNYGTTFTNQGQCVAFVARGPRS